VEQDRPEAVAARERQEAMVEQLRKAELVRDRLESLQQLVGSFPEGNDTRVLLDPGGSAPRAGAPGGGGRHRGASGGPLISSRYLRDSENTSLLGGEVT
jgi:hypothetical protein